MKEPSPGSKPESNGSQTAAGAKPGWSLSQSEISRLRRDVLKNFAPYEPVLQRFVAACFAADETIEAYFHPVYLPIVVKSSGQGLARSRPTGRAVKVTPYVQALNAANQARAMSILSTDTERHKQLVFLASLLHPAGLFIGAHRKRRHGITAPKPLDRYMGSMMSDVLLKPLQALSKMQKEMGLPLASLLGFKVKMEVDPELTSRMATVVYLANLPVRNIWAATDL